MHVSTKGLFLKPVFILLNIAIVSYILLMSYFRPMAADDFLHAYLTSGSIAKAFDCYFFSYINFNPRLGEFFSYLMSSTGTPLLFIIINPFVQLSLIFVLHFMVTGRKIDIHSVKDVSLFIILALLFVFNTIGGQTIFWQAGMANYSLTGLISLGFLSLFRPLLDKKNYISGNLLSKIAVFVLGFLAGMSNENMSVIFLCIIFGILIYYKVNRITLPTWFYWALCGNILGVMALLGAPGSYRRISFITDFYVSDIFNRLHLHETSQQYLESSLFEKLQFLPMRVGKFVVLALGLPVITLAANICILLKKKLKFQHSKYVYYSLGFLFIGFALSGILCFAPKPSIRAYYAPIMFSNMSFAFLLLYLTNEFKAKILSTILVSTFCMAGIIGACILLPAFYKLHTINKINLELISTARETPEKRAELYTPRQSFSYMYSNMGDITEDETFWINVAMAKYYGLNSVVKKMEYPE